MDDVLTDVSRGLAWEAIIERWHNSISKGAISEAVQLANAALTGESPGSSGNESLTAHEPPVFQSW